MDEDQSRIIKKDFEMYRKYQKYSVFYTLIKTIQQYKIN